MTRFVLTSIVAAILFFAIGYSLQGAARMWAFTAFWTVYLAIIGCGAALIQLQFFGPVICRGQSGIALTFDDGPHPTITPALLDLLKRENISVAFFCIGKHVAAYPEIARRIIDEGHLIANHTFNHSWWTTLLGRRGLRTEIESAQAAIADATGVTPIYIRPPVGLTNPHYAGVLKKLGLEMVGWNVRSLDTFLSPGKVIDRVMRQTRDGSIILLHDGGSSPGSVETIAHEIIHSLRSRGFHFERLDKLINPDIDQAGNPPRRSADCWNDTTQASAGYPRPDGDRRH